MSTTDASSRQATAGPAAYTSRAAPPPGAGAAASRSRGWSRLRTVLVAGLVVGALAYAALVMRFLWLEPRMMFLPSAELQPLPADLAATVQRVTIPAADGVPLSAWILPPALPGDSAGWALFFHGSGGNVTRETAMLRRLRDAGLGVVASEYRGYGDAPGTPSERAMYADARATYDWLVRERGIAPSRLVLVGGSRGTAVSIELATHVPVAALVLEGSPANKVVAMEPHFPLVPVRRLMRHRFESDLRVASVHAPMLFVHARGDSVIPVHEARLLYARARAPKRFVTLDGGHGTFAPADEHRYVRELAGFLAQHTTIPTCATASGGCAAPSAP